MRLASPTRRAAMAAGAVTAAVAAAMAFSALGDGPAAAGTPYASVPSASASASASASTSTSTDPIVTPLAAAVVRGPIDIYRTRPSNVVSVRIDFRPGDTTGWHSHPGPVFVQVVSGTITLRHAAHRRCRSEVIRAGHGFFESPGAIHIAENRGRAPAVLFATFVLPRKAGPAVSAPTPAPCR